MDDAFRELEKLYDLAIPEVYGYLLRRCGSVAIAEDLTSRTILSAATAIEHGTVVDLSIPWLITVARNKMIDHFRHEQVVAARQSDLEHDAIVEEDPWDAVDDRDRLHRAIEDLAADHRLVLTLRYIDDLSVAHVASHLGRSVHATESLLVRARNALRHLYIESEESTS